MANYYDWHKTLTYDADVTMVIGPRGIGKTFGLRKQCIKDYIDKGYRMVEAVRYKNELSLVSDNYFDKLSRLDEFKDYMFRTDSRYMYIARKNMEDIEDEYDEKRKRKIHWNIMGYFVALSDEQIAKKRTFNNVRRIIYDEAIIDKKDRYHRYLPNEFTRLANLVDTVSRERADTDGLKPRLYLLANALDIVNPIFVAYNVGFDIPKGYKWFKSKTFLLHNVVDSEYASEKLSGTVAGRMLSGTVDGEIVAYNTFEMINEDFIMEKPKTARFAFGLVLNGKKFGIWDDMKSGFYFITGKIPNNTDRPVYSLSLDDNRVNYIAANRANEVLKNFADFYYLNLLRYSDVKIKSNFIEVLGYFGIR